MNYETDILKILNEAGSEGLSVKKLSQHIFNLHNNLFENVNYNNVYSAVFAYVQKNSKFKNSILQKSKTRGVYKINNEAIVSTQLKLDFRQCDDCSNEKDSETTEEDLSLNLFDFE